MNFKRGEVFIIIIEVIVTILFCIIVVILKGSDFK